MNPLEITTKFRNNFTTQILNPGGEMLIGRSHSCDFTLNDPKISRIHLKVSLPKGGNFPTVTDLGSRNGTILETTQTSKKLNANQDTSWAEGLLKMGESEIFYKTLQPTIPAPNEPMDCNQYRDRAIKELLVELDAHEGDLLLNKNELIKNAIHLSNFKYDSKSEEYKKLFRSISEEIFGMGPISELLDRSDVTDVLVNGYQEIYYESSGLGLKKSNLRFYSEETLIRLIRRIANDNHKRIDFSKPYLDARLKNGSRVHALLPPLSLRGPILSIRKFNLSQFTFEEGVSRGFIPHSISSKLLNTILERKNILISGGTGAGKTTLLNILCSKIDPTERIITIEDAAELNLPLPHVVTLECREASAEGIGEISQRDLLKNVLRMRPDRIIMGECRGNEVIDMLQCMNTGHSGSLSTIHGNSCRDALSRMECMVLLGGSTNHLDSIRRWISNCIDVIIHLKRHPNGIRSISEVCELKGLEGNLYVLQPWSL